MEKYFFISLISNYSSYPSTADGLNNAKRIV